MHGNMHKRFDRYIEICMIYCIYNDRGQWSILGKSQSYYEIEKDDEGIKQHTSILYQIE